MSDATPPSQPGALYPRLPAGRHGLDRELVAAHQRDRLQAALVEVVTQRGYAHTAVAHVVKLAGVSRGTFYEHFTNKEECFVATYDAIMRGVLLSVLSAHESHPAGGWRERLRRSFESLAQEAVSYPLATRFILIDAVAAGEVARERREHAVAGFVSLLRQALEEAPTGVALPDRILRAIVGGGYEVVYRRARSDRLDELPALADDLFNWALGYASKAAAPLAELGPAPGDQPSLHPPAPSAADVARVGPLRWSDQLLVIETARERILAAVGRLVSQRGYAHVSVPDICRAARTSHNTFYSNFEGKQAAFLARYDDMAEEHFAASAAGFARGQTWPASVRSGIEAGAQFLAARPEFASIGLIEGLAAGPAGLDRRDVALTAYTEFLSSGTLQPGAQPTSSITAEATAGAIWEIMYDCVRRSSIDEIPRLVPHATYLALAPYLGAKKAALLAMRPSFPAAGA